MHYTHLGRTGLLVSRLCLGTMNFGPETTEPDSFAIMDRALEHGINFFDSANVYGGKKGEGVTEQIVGRWFAQGGGRREKVVLATKVFGDMGDWPNENRLSALHIRRACEAYGLGLIPWSPLGGGLLGGVLEKLTEGRRASEGMQKNVENNRSKIEAWEGLCRELGEKPADVALAWLLHNKVVTAPIIGPRTLDQLDGSLRALEITLNEETLKRIDGIFPGFRPSPEGYAW